MAKELEKWNEAKDYMGTEHISLGPHYSYVLRKLSRRLLFILSHYKFAAKLIGDGKSVLEVGCSEGLATMVLAECAKKVVGIDFDLPAIEEAKKSFASEKVEFRCLDFLGAKVGSFDAVVAMDVIEHIYRKNETKFYQAVCNNLKRDGIAIIGTPNKTSESYASATSKISHVNLYTWERLRDTLKGYFRQVFIFSANDEMVHTGFYPMAHYLIGVGVCKK